MPNASVTGGAVSVVRVKSLIKAREKDLTRSPNRLSPFRFVLAFGVVSLLADFVYEGSRSIGPIGFANSGGVVFVDESAEEVATA